MFNFISNGKLIKYPTFYALSVYLDILGWLSILEMLIWIVSFQPLGLTPAR